MIPLKQYIVNRLLLDNANVARKVQTSMARYVMVQDDLHYTIRDWPLLKCVFESEGSYILKEMHEVICGAHIELMS